MTVEDRNVVYEAIDILRALGGNNGFSNLQPKMKHLLLSYANKLKAIVEKDIKTEKSMTQEYFDGEIVYD